MKYIMVTNWGRHWDNLRYGRTLFTESMYKGVSKDTLVSGARTIFIKKDRNTREVENTWLGRVYDFQDTIYKGSPAIEFRVKIDKKIHCPKKYDNYYEGWYIETSSKDKLKNGVNLNNSNSDALHPDQWPAIKHDYRVTKHGIGRKIGFIKDNFKREVLIRDIEQAYLLSKIGCYKPAVILAGGVIEELLRLYLNHKKIKPNQKKFVSYIEACGKNNVLKISAHNLTTVSRHFRNIVHLINERDKKDSIDPAEATTAVASIFVLIKGL